MVEVGKQVLYYAERKEGEQIRQPTPAKLLFLHPDGTADLQVEPTGAPSFLLKEVQPSSWQTGAVELASWEERFDA